MRKIYETAIPLEKELKVSANLIYSGNMNRWKRKKIADIWHNEIASHINSGIIKLPHTPTYPVGLYFTFYFRRYPLDVDNCFFMVKMIIDGLRSSGVIPDDDIRFIDEINVRVFKDKTLESDSIKMEVYEDGSN